MIELNRGAPSSDEFMDVVRNAYMQYWKDYDEIPPVSEMENCIWNWVEEELESRVQEEFDGDERMENEEFRDKQYESAMQIYCESEEGIFLNDLMLQCLRWLKFTWMDDVSDWDVDGEGLITNGAQGTILDADDDDECYEYGGI